VIDFSLKNKIALVTGASRGIGEAIALALAENGAHVILVSRKIEALEEVADKIRGKGCLATPMACHMGKLDEIENLFNQIKDQFGRLDILINNAATNPYFGEMIGANEGHWDKTFEVNLKGPFFMIQNAAKLMEAGGGGAIVNVASVNGMRPAPFQGIYSITKAALIMMTKAFARELAGMNIRVNALLPGLTDTKFSQAIIGNKDIYDFAITQIPQKRSAQPEEMAGAALYLVSNASSFTTGICLTCDGGQLI